jgi:16S rRNA (uracil1498-N3)-methyltransferase
MRQLLLPRECSHGERLRLGGQEFHYLRNVLRCSEGERFPAVSPRGERFTATIERFEAGSCTINLVAAGTDSPDRWQPELILVQAVLKGGTFDELVRQATQAGVDRVVPVTTDRTVPRYSSDAERDKKRRRWQRVAAEAVQQSGAAGAPDIDPPVSLNTLLAAEKHEPAPLPLGEAAALGLYLHEQFRNGQTLHSYLESRPRKIVLFIGPEGGLSEQECHALEERGCKPIYLGPRVLRAETAALFAIAAVQILVLESEAWLNKRSIQE